MKRLLLILLLWLAAPALAATYYVSDCGAGASGTCGTHPAGSDAVNTTQAQSQSTPIKTCAGVKSILFASASTMPAGSSILFAKGGAFDACNLTSLINTNATAASPITFGSYDPGSETAVPILNSATGTTIQLEDSGNSDHDEGYVIQDLKFNGAGTASLAIKMRGDVDYVTVQRVEITGYSGAIQCDGGTNQPQNNGDGLSEHMVIRDSNVHHNTGNALLIACNDTLIENNTLDNNGTSGLDHHLYIDDSDLGGVALLNRQIVVRGNTFTNNSPYTSGSPVAGGCKSTAIIVHGRKNGIIIENNVLSEPTVPTSFSCWGISGDTGVYAGIYSAEGLEDIVIRGNTVINFYMGIGVDIAHRVVVENNYIYTAFASNPECGRMRAKYYSAIDSDDFHPDSITFANNSCYINATTTAAASIGFRWDQHASDSASGSNHKVVGNLVQFIGSTAATACFSTVNVSPSVFSEFNYNICNFAGTAGVWMNDGTTASPTTKTKSAWNAATGFDANSTQSNNAANTIFAVTPASGNNYSLATITTSPTKNACASASCSQWSIFGIQRSSVDATKDIGAFEFGQGSDHAPPPPTRITVQ